MRKNPKRSGRLRDPGLVLLSTMILLLCMLLWRAAAQAQDGSGALEGFITVRNGSFELQGKPWFIAGTNIYYLAERAAANETRTVLDSLKQAAGLGLNVVRTGAHSEGEQQLQAVQPRPGQYNETVSRLGPGTACIC
jgi:hypothetical protein